MRRTTNILHLQLATSRAPVIDFMRRAFGQCGHLPRDVDGVGGDGGQRIEFIVDYDGCFERVDFREVVVWHFDVVQSGI